MATAANVKQSNSSHWYYTDGRPCYELPMKSDPTRMKVPTLREARQLNLLPSVTTILKILHKEALVRWQIEQAVLAVLTSPQKEGESTDDFVKRILETEEVQHEQRDAARDRGTQIHDAMELWFTGQKDKIEPEILPWIEPAALAIEARGEPAAVEKCLVGDGYAGRTDLILWAGSHWEIIDWKGTDKLPQKGAWDEHILQGGAYAAAYDRELAAAGKCNEEIGTLNVYISRSECGKFVICEHEPWPSTYEKGFRPLVEYWQFKNSYKPEQNLCVQPV